ncbi:MULTISPECIES: precorrin-3B synthase [unclassified Caballeronia]|uniref:precorrin-3B synthase n=1 Tax=unclassified Caballeronia TaxID=2646786 RepID=UPI00285CF78E|nr:MULTISPECIES: precorrin-3B synthase [unclassified Caballeronia]MDR5818080.1 precorrin-3B synthase [Caballeronia sp. LZ033]MDR5882920.1 precorrin-3B synthase [Caballeronia sp. LZ032]
MPATASRTSACPGLMRVVPARDGGLARLRLTGGSLSADAARAVARAARECGSGVIEVTNRANLQLRGIRADAHARLVDIASAAGLAPATESADDIRNVMLSPLATDATRTLAADLIAAMQADAALHALSPKFALQLDGGEQLAMLDHPHDLWLAALDDGARFAFGLAGTIPLHAHDTPALGVISRDDVVTFVTGVLRRFLALARPDEHRMRDLLARASTHALAFPAPEAALRSWRRAPSDATLRLGAHADNTMAYAGAQAPLGRLDAATLDALAAIATTYAAGRLAMTPWQSVLIPDLAPHAAHDVLHELRGLGLATEPRDPFARLIACAGSAGCAKSRADTKSDAQRLAPLLPAHALAQVHLSGCERSCAAAHPVATTLLARAPGRYDLYRGEQLAACNLTLEEAAERLARSTTDA